MHGEGAEGLKNCNNVELRTGMDDEWVWNGEYRRLQFVSKGAAHDVLSRAPACSPNYRWLQLPQRADRKHAPTDECADACTAPLHALAPVMRSARAIRSMCRRPASLSTHRPNWLSRFALYCPHGSWAISPDLLYIALTGLGPLRMHQSSPVPHCRLLARLLKPHPQEFSAVVSRSLNGVNLGVSALNV